MLLNSSNICIIFRLFKMKVENLRRALKVGRVRIRKLMGSTYKMREIGQQKWRDWHCKILSSFFKEFLQRSVASETFSNYVNRLKVVEKKYYFTPDFLYYLSVERLSKKEQEHEKVDVFVVKANITITFFHGFLTDFANFVS